MHLYDAETKLKVFGVEPEPHYTQKSLNRPHDCCLDDFSNICFATHITASTAEERARPEERRRNELYRQYYEELQRRYDSDRPVDCSVIVVNKAQKYVHSLY